MTADASFGRTWEYRFYDERGLITFARYPQGVGEVFSADEEAWKAADLFKREHSITVTSIERRDPATGEWRRIPVL
ncbi:hypothetical protein [Streptomyces griseofuscus]|uniref:Uncharacterized protein n=1 Tax=Streptomyces griseofuscus TaxID=146922 RepID=A0A426RZ83_9ACTN|nr:hypothetical protein [Streptomyces griseofuscus]RRQ81579.1 hypothetical protein CQW44_30735 [Streptomyces griseofuscus]